MVCDDDVMFTGYSNKILTDWMESGNDVLLNGNERSTNFFLCKKEVFRDLFSEETMWPVDGRDTTTKYKKWGLERADKITSYTEKIGGQYYLDGYDRPFMIHWGGRGDRIDKFFINHKEDGYYNLITWINLYKDKKWFPVSAERLKKSQYYFNKYGLWSLLIAWVPIIGDPITLLAGVLNVRLSIFLFLVSISKISRYVFILYLSSYLI